jgi:hypothetical protein
MQRLCIRRIALLSVLVCASVAAVSVWPHGRRVRTEDRNGDGRPDVWQDYDDKGQPTEVRIDTNFDGRSDVQEYYEKGRLVRRESDRNFDDRIDLVEEFDAATHEHVRSVVDCDYDGAADLLVLFHEGRPVFSKYVRALTVNVWRPHGVWDRDLQRDPRRDDENLAPLTDPFRADASFRGPQAMPSAAESASVTTSSGLPKACFGVTSPIPPLAQLMAVDVQAIEPARLSVRSPRGPPLS